MKEQCHIGKEIWTWGERTYVMGILNVTPDSFSDGGRYNEMAEALKHAELLINEGADIIDIGGESTRPGATTVTVEEEIARVVPIISCLSQQITAPISIDTYHVKTAEAALKAGAHMLNDVWGLKADPDMAGLAAQYNVPICIMHNKKSTQYDNLIEDMKRELAESIEIALKAGIQDEQIILDPGIGFGKTWGHNVLVMRHLEEFKQMGYPVLLGTSRKSFIGMVLDLPVQERIEGTIATTVTGITKGIDIVRVHDVKENKRAALMTDKMVR